MYASNSKIGDSKIANLLGEALSWFVADEIFIYPTSSIKTFLPNKVVLSSWLVAANFGLYSHSRNGQGHNLPLSGACALKFKDTYTCAHTKLLTKFYNEPQM